MTISINGCENWAPSEGPNPFDLWKRSELSSRFGTFIALEKGLNYAASAHYIDKILAETSYVLSSGKKCKSIWLLILQSSIAWGHVKCPSFYLPRSEDGTEDIHRELWGWQQGDDGEGMQHSCLHRAPEPNTAHGVDETPKRKPTKRNSPVV